MIKLFYTETRFVTILALHYKWSPQWPILAHKYTGIHSNIPQHPIVLQVRVAMEKVKVR